VNGSTLSKSAPIYAWLKINFESCNFAQVWLSST
jgi:hypothetical protein